MNPVPWSCPPSPPPSAALSLHMCKPGHLQGEGRPHGEGPAVPDIPLTFQLKDAPQAALETPGGEERASI